MSITLWHRLRIIFPYSSMYNLFSCWCLRSIQAHATPSWWVKIWILTWLFQNPQGCFFFRDPFINKLECLVLLSCYNVYFWLSFNFLTDGLMLSSSTFWHNEWFLVASMKVSCPGPDAAKQLQTITLPSPCFIIGIKKSHVVKEMDCIIKQYTVRTFWSFSELQRDLCGLKQNVIQPWERFKVNI